MDVEHLSWHPMWYVHSLSCGKFSAKSALQTRIQLCLLPATKQWTRYSLQPTASTPFPQKIVTLGMHKIKQDDSSEFYKIEHIPIAESVVHPNFDTSTADNDFWIIRLQWASKLYSGNVAQLDTPTDTLVLSSTSGADLVVIGFGRSVPWEPAAVMREVVVDYISNAECVSVSYGYIPREITPNMMCAGRSGKGSCYVCVWLISDVSEWKHWFVCTHQLIISNRPNAVRLWRSSPSCEYKETGWSSFLERWGVRSILLSWWYVSYWVLLHQHSSRVYQLTNILPHLFRSSYSTSLFTHQWSIWWLYWSLHH